MIPRTPAPESTACAPPADEFSEPPRLKARPSLGLSQYPSPDPRATPQQQHVAKRHGKDSGTIASLTKAPKSDFLIERMAPSPPPELLVFYIHFQHLLLTHGASKKSVLSPAFRK